MKMVFTLYKNGSPGYEVYWNNKPVILPSRLGFKLNVDSLFDRSFQLTSTERKSFDQTWQTVWGETKYVRNHYEELTVYLQSAHSPGMLLNIVFRVFENGVGFRYKFPLRPNLEYFISEDGFYAYMGSDGKWIKKAPDQKPIWLSSQNQGNNFLVNNLKFHEESEPARVPGKVEIRVYLDEQGNVTDY